MTEEDARKKWCPFSRPIMPRADDCGFQPGNRTEDGQIWPANQCIASACMAWRLNDDYDVPMGYCGLAGKP